MERRDCEMAGYYVKFQGLSDEEVYGSAYDAGFYVGYLAVYYSGREEGYSLKDLRWRSGSFYVEVLPDYVYRGRTDDRILVYVFEDSKKRPLTSSEWKDFVKGFVKGVEEGIRVLKENFYVGGKRMSRKKKLQEQEEEVEMVDDSGMESMESFGEVVENVIDIISDALNTIVRAVQNAETLSDSEVGMGDDMMVGLKKQVAGALEIVVMGLEELMDLFDFDIEETEDTEEVEMDVDTGSGESGESEFEREREEPVVELESEEEVETVRESKGYREYCRTDDNNVILYKTGVGRNSRYLVEDKKNKKGYIVERFDKAVKIARKVSERDWTYKHSEIA